MRVTFPLMLSFAIPTAHLPMPPAAVVATAAEIPPRPARRASYGTRKRRNAFKRMRYIFPDSELTEQAWALARKGEFEAGRILFSASPTSRTRKC